MSAREKSPEATRSSPKKNSNSKSKAPAKPQSLMCLWEVELKRARRPGWKPPAPVEGNLSDDEESQCPGWLGIDFQNRGDGHFIITNIQEGSPAFAGQKIMVGDIVAFIAGFNMRALNSEQMRTIITGSPGTKIKITCAAEFMRTVVDGVSQDEFSASHLLASGVEVKVARVVSVKLKSSVGLDESVDPSSLTSLSQSDRPSAPALWQTGDADPLALLSQSSLRSTNSKFGSSRGSLGGAGAGWEGGSVTISTTPMVSLDLASCIVRLALPKETVIAEAPMFSDALLDRDDSPSDASTGYTPRVIRASSPHSPSHAPSAAGDSLGGGHAFLQTPERARPSARGGGDAYPPTPETPGGCGVRQSLSPQVPGAPQQSPSEMSVTLEAEEAR